MKISNTNIQHRHYKPEQFSPDSLTAALSLTTNQACSYLPYFELTQHLSLSAPEDLSASLHIFTSHVSFHLSTHQSSIYLWPITRLHHQPTELAASRSPFSTVLCWFDSLVSVIPSPSFNLLPLSTFGSNMLIPRTHPLSCPVISLPHQFTQTRSEVLPAILAASIPICVCQHWTSRWSKIDLSYA